MDVLIAQILAAVAGLASQALDLQQRKQRGEVLTEQDLAAERQKTQQLLAQGDALRSTPRNPSGG